jgi:hypothetical protein
MNYFILFVALLSTTGLLKAETFASRIHSIDIGDGSESHLIRFDNGRVSFVEARKKNLLETLRRHEKNHEVKVSTDAKNNIYAVSVMDDPIDDDDQDDSETEPYEPVVVKNTNAALKVFRSMRRDYSLSGECYNRAHIWTVEAKRKADLNLMKIFMFFTERYIRKYKYHWWFHVTPMVYVGNMNSPRTLDRRYTSGPRQTRTWSNTFIKSKKACKIVEKFDDFYMNQQKEDCYHIYTSMYYVKPRDIEKRDLTGVEKTEFIDREVSKALKNAFRKTPRRRTRSTRHTRNLM